MTNHRSLIALMTGALLLSAPAWASVHLPPTPVPPEVMESFAACKARLDAMKEDLKAWSSTPIEKNGNVWGKQTSPTTGVEILSARRARFVDYRVITNYDVTDPSQVRAQSTTTETTYTCDGRVLSGVTENWAGMEMFMTLDDVPKK
ncbi:MAG: hypothetical protein AAGC76_10420 [Luteibacter sp.]|uniref:hypothetical protein n=1 Tax=Luteibacter sp. TaxID=1886636 RepID=UPI00280830AC|nr:hypothetical protein [Luteibacter sp.]MDQ7996254.1 hypothetical protein [Luteibacter sp.]MDQ8049491.1 hypothetical protein [Luteibacter sp.]